MITEKTWNDLYPDVVKSLENIDDIVALSIKPVKSPQVAYNNSLKNNSIVSARTDWVSFKDAVLKRVGLNCETFYSKVLNRQPTYRSHSEVRYFNRGSFKVDLNAKHTGRWTSFEHGYKSGNAIDLLMDSELGYGLDFKKAVQAAATLSGVNEDDYKEAVINSAALTENTHNSSFRHKDKTTRIRRIISECIAIEGSIVENYLKKHRGITCLKNLQLKFHPSIYDSETKQHYPALIVIGLNERGETSCYQSTLLDPNTSNKADNIQVVKRSYGSISGSVGLIQKGRNSQVIFAEGNETAASIALAYSDATVYSLFGSPWNLGKLAWVAHKHKTDTLYFAADNDGDNIQTQAALKKSLSKLSEQGIIINIAMPTLLPGANKTDWNDILCKQGITLLKRQLMLCFKCV